MERRIRIGLTGRMASGKGEVIKILQKMGFQAISLSDLVREEAHRLGGNLTREQMQELGNHMRQEEGPGVLGKRVRESIENSPFPLWVIDGIRNPAEVRELKQLPFFYLVGIEAGMDTILKRLKTRDRDTDQQTQEELIKNLDREWGKDEPTDGQQVGACMTLSDFRIKNESSLEELETSLSNLLKKVGFNHE